MVIRHPFEALDERRLGRATAVLGAAFAVLTALLVQTVSFGDLRAVEQLVRAGSGEARAILAQWPLATTQAFAFLLGFDFLYAAVHDNGVALLAIWGARRLATPAARNVGALTAWVLWVDTALNAAENLALLSVLRTLEPSPLWPMARAIFAFRAATLVTGLLVAVGLHALAGQRARHRRRNVHANPAPPSDRATPRENARARDPSMHDRPPRFDERFRERLDDLFRWRRDVRRFRSDPIDAPTLAAVLRTAALAPSVGNSQPWRFVTVGDPARRAQVREIFRASNADALAGYRGEQAKLYASLKLSGLDTAPVQLAVFVEPEPVEGAGLGRRTMPETVSYSAVLAVHTLWLAGRARGVGVGWVSILDPHLVRRVLAVDERWVLVAYLCLGVPEEEHLEPELERAGWQARRDPATFIVER